MENKLEVCKVKQVYRDKIALKDINLTLKNGIYGLVGPNGAGKTTLINVIIGLIKPTEGIVKYKNKEINEFIEDYLSVVGYLPQYPHFYDEFSCVDFLYYMAELKGLDKAIVSQRVDELLRLCNLFDDKKRKVKTFSGGMKQRLGIAQALLNDPKILILDEPTAGLDPKERIRFRNIISTLSTNKIIVLATHILEDIESIANQVILISKGEILKIISTQDLLVEIKDKIWQIEIDQSELEYYQNKVLITGILNENSICRIRYIGERINNSLQVIPKLEEVYLYYFGG